MDRFQPLFVVENGRRQVNPAAPFSTEPSCRWWLRLHAAEAIERGALLKHTGALFFDPEALTRVCVDVGRRAAARTYPRDRLSVDLPEAA